MGGMRLDISKLCHGAEDGAIRIQYAFVRVKDPNVNRIHVTMNLLLTRSVFSESTPQVCSDKLVWRWRSRRQEGSLPHTLQRSCQILARNSRRYQCSQRGLSFFIGTSPDPRS